jgi:hypothetical protein
MPAYMNRIFVKVDRATRKSAWFEPVCPWPFIFLTPIIFAVSVGKGIRVMNRNERKQ